MKSTFQIFYAVAFIIAAFLAFATTYTLFFPGIILTCLLIYILGEVFLEDKPKLKWITRLVIFLVVLIYIKYPKELTFCGGFTPCHSKFQCNGIFITGDGGDPFCAFGELKKLN